MPQGHALYGRLWMQQNKFEEARDELRRALELDPALAGVRTNLGTVLYRLGHVTEAIRELLQAVHENPQSAEAEFQLGLALFASGAQQDAKAAFEHAIKLDPDLVEARINLGQLEENESRMSEAIAQYRRAIQAAPHNSGAAVHLARALAKPRLSTRHTAFWTSPSATIQAMPRCISSAGSCWRAWNIGNRPCAI